MGDAEEGSGYRVIVKESKSSEKKEDQKKGNVRIETIWDIIC